MSSEIVPKFFGKIINGVRHYNRPQQYLEWMKTLEGKEFEEVITERFIEASNDQHGYYRATVRWLCNETEMFAGWDEKALHKYIMDTFAGTTVTHEIRKASGEVEKKDIVITPSVSSLSRKSMSKLIDSLLNWLGGNEIYPPEPDQIVTKKFKTRITNEKPKSDTSR